MVALQRRLTPVILRAAAGTLWHNQAVVTVSAKTGFQKRPFSFHEGDFPEVVSPMFEEVQPQEEVEVFMDFPLNSPSALSLLFDDSQHFKDQRSGLVVVLPRSN